MSVRGFSFRKKEYEYVNKQCYDHDTYITNGLHNEMVDTIPNIRKALRDDGITAIYDDGVIKLFEKRQSGEGMDFIGKASLTLVGDTEGTPEIFQGTKDALKRQCRP